MTVHPRHPTHLEGSKWSKVGESVDFRHWEVREYRKRSKTVVVFAVLDTSVTEEIPWRQLRERDCWKPGWNE